MSLSGHLFQLLPHPPPPIPLPGLPFLGPLEAEQLVDVRSPLSSMGDE